MQALVIGYGSIGKRHIEVLKEFSEIENLHVVTSQQTSLPDIARYENINAALDYNRYDYVVIASPTYRHKQDLENILKRNGTGSILVEKPLFDKYSENFSEELENVFIGYNLRFHPVIQEIQKMLSEHGEVLYANLMVGQYLPTWRPGRNYREGYSAKKSEGGGVLRDLSHELDLLHWLFGEAEKFSAIATHRSNLEIDTEDIVLLQGVTKKKVLFSVSLDYISKEPVRRILIHTQDATIQADLITSTVLLSKTNSEGLKIDVEKPTRNFTYKRMHENIIKKRFQDVCSFKEGLRINHWIDKILEQNQT